MKPWSLAALKDTKSFGPIVFSAVVRAALCCCEISQTALSSMFAWLDARRHAFPFAAAYPAGHAHRLYRESGGRRAPALPDVLIGAHALVAGHCRLTRDASCDRGDAPGLVILSPETRP